MKTKVFVCVVTHTDG